MCGICGIVDPAKPDLDRGLLESMARTMNHRGPDDEGYQLFENGAGFGFKRLSIIDLSRGHQPMSNEDDSLWIVFNGEIYNFQDIRKDLDATGRHRFKTECDTEVILHAYEEYGDACLERLRGMFAFAIWDRKKQTLFAARDRFGKKPFNYFITPGGGIVFSSELKALLKHPDCPSDIDPRSIHLYLSLQYIPSPRTIYRNVAKLPPAHALRWTAAEGVRTWRYWDLRYDPKDTLSYDEAKRRLRARVDESVRLRMIADVPLGAFLSGGIDSSIVVASMAQQSSKPIQTFSIGFEEEAYSELHYARQVADRYKTDHHEFIVKPALIDILPKLAWYYSEPFADSSGLPSYYVSQMTRRHVTVALNGDGGDEVFAGYLRYRAMWGMQFWNWLPESLRRTVHQASLALPHSEAPIGWSWRIQRLFQVGALPPLRQYLRTLDYFHPEELEELWTPDYLELFQKEKIASQYIFEETMRRSTPKEMIDRLLFLDLNHYLPDCLMIKMDVASMANSLEARSPLLDHVLAEEVARFPSSWKYRPLNHSKRILKDAYAADLPPIIRTRGKQGFGVPISQWFRGALKDYLRETILSPKALARGYFRPETLRRYVDEHQSGKRDRCYGLWALLMLELWHQVYREHQYPEIA